MGDILKGLDLSWISTAYVCWLLSGSPASSGDKAGLLLAQLYTSTAYKSPALRAVQKTIKLFLLKV